MNPDAAERWLEGVAGRTLETDAAHGTALRARVWTAMLANLPADATGAWLLYEEHGTCRTVALSGERVVGRGEEATLRIDCRWLSRRQFTLRQRAEGFEIEHAGGRNATHVNDEVVASRRLVSGDVIRVADAAFLFVYIDPSA